MHPSVGQAGTRIAIAHPERVAPAVALVQALALRLGLDAALGATGVADDDADLDDARTRVAARRTQHDVLRRARRSGGPHGAGTCHPNLASKSV
jgi:hypothetical protein